MLACLVIGVAMPVAVGQPQGPPDTQHAPTWEEDTPPMELVAALDPFAASMVVSTDLKISYFDWETLLKRVTITRKEREFSSEPWSAFSIQKQRLSTSYFVLDVRGQCDPATSEIGALYVAGVHGENPPKAKTAVIERWTFDYPAAATPYTPLEDRPRPTVQRMEILRTTQYGLIRAIEVDPEGRFLLFVTYDNPRLFRIDLQLGDVDLLHTQATIPELPEVGSILAREHAVEGRQFQLLLETRWSSFANTERWIVLPDPDNDGILGTPEVLLRASGEARGYFDDDSWIRPCRPD